MAGSVLWLTRGKVGILQARTWRKGGEMDKNRIRSQMREALKKLTPEERHTRSLAVCRRLEATSAFRAAQSVMLFFSMKSEVETAALALSAWQSGKSIVVPRVIWQERLIEPVEVNSLETEASPHVPGLRQPKSGSPVSLSMIDIVAVPGLAFDLHGYRVGRGKGFYDRFLPQKDLRAVTVALCFDEQVLADFIPAEPHDVPVKIIVTDKRTIHCAAD